METMDNRRKWTVVSVLLVSLSVGAYAKESVFADIAHALNARPQTAPSSPQIEVGFSPDAGAEDLVVKAIATAKQTILLGAYSFTSKPVIQALIAAKKRGVDVRCVLDKSNPESKSGTAAANLLVNAGIPTRINSEHSIHHNKYLVIDGAHVETGVLQLQRAGGASECRERAGDLEQPRAGQEIRRQLGDALGPFGGVSIVVLTAFRCGATRTDRRAQPTRRKQNVTGCRQQRLSARVSGATPAHRAARQTG